MIPAMIAVTILVIVTILIHYEVLRFTSDHLRDIPVVPHARILVVVIAVFAAHTVEVWIYGLAYWLFTQVFGLGGFGGQPVAGFEDSLYFSAVTYTSLGLGDYYPTRHLRLIAGVEALNGLVLIGWSASFTYLTMERYWPLHGKTRRRRHLPARAEPQD
jgi:Ion channel